MLQNRNRLKEIERIHEEEGRAENIESEDIPGIKREENMAELSMGLDECLQVVMEENEVNELDSSLILRGLMKSFKWQMLKALFFYLGESFCRLGFSIMLYYLLQVVTNLDDTNTHIAYLLAFFSGFVWLFGQFLRHNGFY